MPVDNGFLYEPRIRQVFINRARIDKLLLQERENGSLSDHDYRAIVDLWSSRVPLYPIYGMTVASIMPWAYLIRRSLKLSAPPSALALVNMLGLTSCVGLMGFMAGAGIGRSSVDKVFKSLENLEGFQTAMDNVMQSKQNFGPGDELTQSLPDPDSKPELVTAKEPVTTTSRWDEIRNANLRGATPSAWELLRQKQERAKLPKPQPRDKESTQAEFDELLERERNFKS
ncbi:hypothetical protein C8J56DRAFT_1159102 [Mycena floridula]|nr:hypothetical protein C8J56DRAFT_1159102 [Mycena floridula]